MKIDCLYFKALIPIKNTVRFAALFRSYEDNFAFDRTLCPKTGLFEFFVPIGFRVTFISAMNMLQGRELVLKWWEEVV